MKHFYSDENGVVNLLNLDEGEFFTIKRYFHSIGIDVFYKMYDIEQYDIMYSNHFNKEKKENLEDYVFKIKIQNKIFVL